MAETEPPGAVPLNARRDERGLLVVIEGGRDIPFDIARVYFIRDAQGSKRGFHAHRQLEQVALCVAGSCRMLLDDGRDRRSVTLDQPDQGVRIPPMIWREMSDFSEDCVLMVLASASYDEADYIRDYAAFLAEVGSVE